MPASPEAHEVHIETLYKKIEELAQDCETQHRTGLGEIQRVHQRLDDFTKILIQMSEINKDVQSVTAHQKTLDGAVRHLGERVDSLVLNVQSHGLTVASVHRIAWGVAAFVSVAIGTAVFKLVGL